MKIYKIKTNKGQRRIKVTVPYNPIYIKKTKDVKGYSWNPEQKCWTFPYSDVVIKKLLDIFKDEDIWIDPSLLEVYTQYCRNKQDSHPVIRNWSHKKEMKV